MAPIILVVQGLALSTYPERAEEFNSPRETADDKVSPSGSNPEKVKCSLKMRASLDSVTRRLTQAAKRLLKWGTFGRATAGSPGSQSVSAVTEDSIKQEKQELTRPKEEQPLKASAMRYRAVTSTEHKKLDRSMVSLP